MGAASAALMRKAGARVTIIDLNDELGRAHAAAIGATFVKADISDEASVATALDTAHAANGVARILVNCAGVAPAMRVVGEDGAPHSLDFFRKTLEINLVGVFNVLAQFAARLSAEDVLDEERGVVINTASIAAFDGLIGQAAYAAAKGGIVAMTLPIARDLAKLRIRIMTIAPGIFKTPMLMGLPQAAQDAFARQVPHPSRLGYPEEFAQLVESIITNPMLNGEVIRLDGAIRMSLSDELID